MTYRLIKKEEPRKGMSRILAGELEGALACLDAGPQGILALGEDTVHDLRKHIKRVRAALKLVRAALGEASYRGKNLAFRDAGRRLTAIRDTEMLVETWEKLRFPPSVRASPRAEADISALFRARRERARTRLRERTGTLAHLAGFFRGERASLGALVFHREGWDAMEPGLRHAYRDGRRALGMADRDRTEENLHEWRKQAKVLWHQLQLLEAYWRPHERSLGERVHALVDALGEDHDLAELRRRLVAEAGKFGGRAKLRPILARIDHQRRGLQNQSFHLGERLYAAPPYAFTRRMERFWHQASAPRLAKPLRGKVRERSSGKYRGRRQPGPISPSSPAP